jgi:hypothetical protein
MERMWFRDSLAAWPPEDDRERQARKRRRRVLLGCAVIAVLLALLLAWANARALGIGYWQSRAQPCGTLDFAAGQGIKVGAGPSTASDAQAAATCFGQAYARCQAATLVETFAYSDQVSTYTYLIEPPLFAIASAAHTCSLAV